MNDASKAQILQCPDCKEYIASDAQSCRFCRRVLDSRTIQMAVTATQRDNKKYRRDHYMKHMAMGFGLFALGLILTVGSLWAAYSSETGGYYVVTWGLVIVGGGDFLYGVFGMLGEVLSRK